MNDHLMKNKKEVYLGPQMFDESTEDDYPNRPTNKISSIPSSYSSDSLSSLYNKGSYSKYPQNKNFGYEDERNRKLSIGNGFGDNMHLKGKDLHYNNMNNNKHNEGPQNNTNYIPRSKSTNFSLSRQYLYNDNNMFRYPQREMEYQEDYGIFQRHPKMMHNTQFFLEKSLQNIEYNDVDSNYQHSLEASILGSLIEPRLIDDVALLYKTYSRSLFVANVASTLSVQEITNLFEKYGELKGILFEFRKMAHFIIVKYYDLRSARDAYHSLNGCSIHSQKLVIRNCVPIEPETEQTNCFVIIRNIKRENCSTMNLMKHFKHFGDIKDITDVVFNPNFQNNNNFVVHKIIEFYDSRAVDNLFHSYSSYLVQQQPQPQSNNNNSQQNNGLSSSSPFSEIFAIFSPKSTPISFERPNYSIIDKLLSPFVISCKKLISYANHQQMQEKKMSYKHNYPPMHSMRGSYPLEEEEGSEDIPSEEEHYNGKKGNNTVSISSSPSSPLLPFYSSNIKGKKEKGKPQSSTTSTKFVQPQEEKQPPRRKTETVSDPSLYELHLNAVRNGEDKRTTLMIKNIPNKYDQEMLLKAINKTHKHHFDFFYLPIDLKHDCNVGYAFINFIYYKSIPSFVERFNKTKWKKFNSEKICDIAYARLQGKQELINHFQNSTRIKYDKKCRPVVFASEGPNKGKEEDFPFNFEDEDNVPSNSGSGGNNNNTNNGSGNTNNNNSGNNGNNLRKKK